MYYTSIWHNSIQNKNKNKNVVHMFFLNKCKILFKANLLSFDIKCFYCLYEIKKILRKSISKTSWFWFSSPKPCAQTHFKVFVPLTLYHKKLKSNCLVHKHSNQTRRSRLLSMPTAISFSPQSMDRSLKRVSEQELFCWWQSIIWDHHLISILQSLHQKPLI